MKTPGSSADTTLAAYGQDRPDVIARFSALLALVFIASVPLQTIRLAELSVSIFAALALAALAPISILFAKRPLPDIKALDWLIALYLLAVLPSVNSADGFELWIKGVAYLVGYAGLRVSLHHIADFDRFLLLAAKAGLLSLAAMIGIGIYLAGISTAELLRFDYWSVTYRVFEGINNALGGDAGDDFSGADVMRNTTSDSTVLLAGIMVLQGKLWWPVAAGFAVFLLQSRRAMLNLVYMFAVPAEYRSYRFALLGLMGIVGIVVLVGADGLNFQTRYTEFDETTRAVQYRAVFEQFSFNWATGLGYGAQVYDAYVHNFILASAYMSGVFPAVLALAIFVTAGFGLVSGKSPYRHLFIISLPHMLVAPTVGGVFPLQIWAMFAIVLEAEQRFAKSP